MNKFVFTCGDINGIGPEIVIKTLNLITRYKTPNKFYFICPLNIFKAPRNILNQKIKRGQISQQEMNRLSKLSQE